MRSRILVDCAGAHIAGARRFLDELDGYLATKKPKDLDLIGRGGYVTPAWLVRREFGHQRQARSVALNNVAFSHRGRERWVLLRNALHFLDPAEADGLGDRMSRQVQLQVPVVRATAARADVLVVPTSAMGARVAGSLPGAAKRIIVRPHPASPYAHPQSRDDRTLLCPVVFSPYKQMTSRLRLILRAVQIVTDQEAPVRVIATATASEIKDAVLTANPCLNLVGRKSTAQVRDLAARCGAVLYPTTLESFGYPLAEARVNRQPVVAMATAQNREVAGDALVGYERETAEDIAGAISAAFRTRLPDISVPELDPVSYFDWLLDLRPTISETVSPGSDGLGELMPRQRTRGSTQDLHFPARRS